MTETHADCGLSFQTTKEYRSQRKKCTKMGSPQEKDYTTLGIIYTLNEEE